MNAEAYQDISGYPIILGPSALRKPSCAREKWSKASRMDTMMGPGGWRGEHSFSDDIARPTTITRV